MAIDGNNGFEKNQQGLDNCHNKNDLKTHPSPQSIVFHSTYAQLQFDRLNAELQLCI